MHFPSAGLSDPQGNYADLSGLGHRALQAADLRAVAVLQLERSQTIADDQLVKCGPAIAPKAALGQVFQKNSGGHIEEFRIDGPSEQGTSRDRPRKNLMLRLNASDAP